jgi:hypothetical protein
MKPYKVIYHQGDTVGWSTKAMRGMAEVSERGLTITGVHDGGTLFVTVIRFMIGQFATVNFFATGALRNRLLALIDPAPNGPWTLNG